AADANRYRLTVDLELGMGGNLLLHLGSRVQGVIRARKGRHDLIAHGLDDGSVPLLSRAPHDVDADRDHIACAQVAHQLIEPGRADHVGEQNCEFDILAHVFQANGLSADTPRSYRLSDAFDYTRPKSYRYRPDWARKSQNASRRLPETP